MSNEGIGVKCPYCGSDEVFEREIPGAGGADGVLKKVCYLCDAVGVESNWTGDFVWRRGNV